ncbi:putative F-box protein At1g53550 [Nicotiana tabacum]|uniref:F-box protein At1g53550 n=1 Tax=Nicotiana tabacum TaxID=4097 RepID=A0AC58RVY7_TOBAC
MICCSIGFDPITKKPKVFKAHVRNYEARYWIFTIGVDKSWREIFDCAKSIPGSNFVCIGGVFYFVNRLIGMPYNIVAFSAGNEKFMRRITLPDQALTSILPQKITEIKGQIAVLDQKFFEGDVKVSLYVLKGIDETERWVKHIIKLPSNLRGTSIWPLFKTNSKGEIVLITRSTSTPSTILDIFLYDIAKKKWREVAINRSYDQELLGMNRIAVLLNFV